MSDASRERLEQRIVILTPTGKDAPLTRDLLGKNGFDCTTCADMPQLARELERGAGAVLVAEEAITAAGGALLARTIVKQPPWSDLPVLLLTGGRGGEAEAVKALTSFGNVSLLERPVHVATLVSTVRTALRARNRQYQTRAHFREREEADQRKDEFLATLAHELRNPLAPIRNAVQILRMSEGVPPAAAKLSEMMERQVAQMVRLVDDLLEMSRITRGRIDLRKKRVTLASVIETSLDISRPLIEGAQHTLTLSLPPEPLYVDADPTRLAQVFANLLNNSAKYTDAGGRIALSAVREGQSVTVRIVDNGTGISPSALPRIFDIFVQADHASDRVQGGLGIGLTLVRQLVEMHGGTVEAHSGGVGKGSELIVRLPLATASVEEGRQPLAAKVDSGKAAPRVLVVDDNRDAAKSLGLLLEMLGADVLVVHDGNAALEAVASSRPRAVFLDLGMPGMDGYEVARKIRERTDGDDPTLIALTGWGQERDRRESQAAGFDHHLVKPAELSVLQALLESVSSAVP